MNRGGKFLVNLGKVSVLSLLAFSIFLSPDTFAGRRGSKTSGSSKRSASSQKTVIHQGYQSVQQVHVMEEWLVEHQFLLRT